MENSKPPSDTKVLGRDPFAQPASIPPAAPQARARSAERAARQSKPDEKLPRRRHKGETTAERPFAPAPAWPRAVMTAAADAFDRVDAFGLNPRYAERVDRLLDPIYRRYFRTRVRGAENIPSEGKAIIVANHSGAVPVDWLILSKAVRAETSGRRQLRPLVEDSLYHFPFLNSFMARVGGVRACQENAERLLDVGEIVAVFPEGAKGTSKPYSQRYKLQRFGRGGFIKLAVRTRSPLIPAAVVGSEEAFPVMAGLNRLATALGLPYFPVSPLSPFLGPLAFFPLPSKWLIQFGEPLALDYETTSVEDTALTNRLSEKVRDIIQAMIVEGLRQRGSAFF